MFGINFLKSSLIAVPIMFGAVFGQSLDITCDQFSSIKSTDNLLTIQNIYGISEQSLEGRQCVFAFRVENEEEQTTTDKWFGYLYRFKGCVKPQVYALPQIYTGMRPSDYSENNNVPLIQDKLQIQNDQNIYNVISMSTLGVEIEGDYNIIMKTFMVKEDPESVNTNGSQVCEIQVLFFGNTPLQTDNLELITKIQDTFGTVWIIYKLQEDPSKCLYKIVMDPEQDIENMETYSPNLFGTILENETVVDPTQIVVLREGLSNCGKYIKVGGIMLLQCDAYFDLAAINALKEVSPEDLGETFITSVEFGTEIYGCGMNNYSQAIFIVTDFTIMEGNEVLNVLKKYNLIN